MEKRNPYEFSIRYLEVIEKLLDSFIKLSEIEREKLQGALEAKSVLEEGRKAYEYGEEIDTSNIYYRRSVDLMNTVLYAKAGKREEDLFLKEISKTFLDRRELEPCLVFTEDIMLSYLYTGTFTFVDQYTDSQRNEPVFIEFNPKGKIPTLSDLINKFEEIYDGIYSEVDGVSFYALSYEARISFIRGMECYTRKFHFETAEDLLKKMKLN